MVEFTWVFSAPDLANWREVVFKWGNAVVGRYRCFGARLLAAINCALDEPTSQYQLAEPRGTETMDGVVSGAVPRSGCCTTPTRAAPTPARTTRTSSMPAASSVA
jgi:hypothetical protein